jgi:hypothetical protein
MRVPTQESPHHEQLRTLPHRRRHRPDRSTPPNAKQLDRVDLFNLLLDRINNEKIA